MMKLPDFDMRPVEFFMALAMVAWGSMLLHPSVSLDGPLFKYLLAFAPELVWAGFAIGTGFLRIIALLANGAWPRGPALRSLGAGLGVAWWLVLIALYSFAFNDGVPPFPGFGWLFVWCCAELTCVMFCGRDERYQRSRTQATRAANGRRTVVG